MWRVHFMIGAMAFTMMGIPVLQMVPADAAFEDRLRWLVRFLGAGFQAPAEVGGR